MGHKLPDGQIVDPCLESLKPGESFFVLRAQDALASAIVRQWIEAARAAETCAPEKLKEAERVANAMDRWPHQRLPT